MAKSPSDQSQPVPQPVVPPETGSASLANMEGEKDIETTPTRPIGHAALKGLAVNCKTTVLPELPTTRSVFVIVTNPPLTLVVRISGGFVMTQFAPRIEARMPSAKTTENKCVATESPPEHGILDLLQFVLIE